MDRQAIIPSGMQGIYQDWKMAPGHLSGGHIFLTGFTGVNPDGSISDDPEAQMRSAFDQIGSVLSEAGLDFGALVEMTSYHIGLRDHLELFKSVRAEYVKEPYPAWTAIEVAGFASEGVTIEIRAIARAG